MRYRAFCVNYEPRSLALSKELIDGLMASADVCLYAPKGIPVGAKVNALNGKRLRCVAHEHHGKIVILVEDEP